RAGDCRGSWPGSLRDSRVQRDDSAGKEAVAHIGETRLAQETGEVLGSGEALHARGEVGVCRPAGQQLPEHGDDLPEPAVVEGLERALRTWDLEDAHPSTRSQHS